MSETPTNVRVQYHIDATINLGNFENVKPGYVISADVPDGTSPSAVRAKLKATADAWLEQDIEAFRAEAAQ